MPGLTAFNRRWSVGSDDFVLPGGILSLFHFICGAILTCALCLINYRSEENCVVELWIFNIVYLATVGLCLGLELLMSFVSYKGSILNTEPRSAVKYILYVRLGVLLAEIAILGYGIYWLTINYHTCQIDYAKTVFLVLIVLNWFTIVCIFFNTWCAYDPAGRSWVKMKTYQRSMRESESKYQYKRSGSTRNWRQRKVMKAYQDSWDQRCRLLFCCMRSNDSNRNSFREIARLLSDYFRDLDVVPSDVIAGIILLRIYQKIERKAIIEQRKNDTYEFLSGVPVTSKTKFLSLQEDGTDLDLFQTVIRYVYFAVRAYGWPMYAMTTKMGICRICSNASCCCFMNRRSGVEVIEDNCCQFNRAALQTLSELGNIEVIYATYHVDIGKTPFFIALDYDREKIVLSIRGTLSMKDILTDLNAEAETIPVEPMVDEWLGHKGMVTAAEYILEKIKAEKLLQRAHNYRTAVGTKTFDLVIVGHSLGAGIASILGILLRNEYPNLVCYCYSPPGGLLSAAAMNYTKAFTISVVLGKDVVPRLGLNQMEALRADLINAMKRSVDPKWKIISCGVMCCCCSIEPTSATELSTADQAMTDYIKEKKQTRVIGGVHPSDSSIALTTHQPMYPPGRIIHVVRHHPSKDEQKYEKTWRKALAGSEPVYQAIWAENTDFDEVLISPVMIQDHMPDKLLTALNKVIITMGPKKPKRTNIEIWKEYRMITQDDDFHQERPESRNVYLETCFTTLADLQPTTPSIISEPISESNNFIYKQINGKLPLLDRNKNLDLLHKRDLRTLCAIAPLAQPETFSDSDSNKSYTSHAEMNSTCWTTQINAPSPSVLKAPHMMRRTPKIIGNLSTCSEDIRNVKSFEKTKALNLLLEDSNSSSNLSYTSGLSNKTNGSNDYEHFVGAGQCSWQRETSVLRHWEPENGSDISRTSALAEEMLDEILEFADCADFFKSNSSFLEGYDEKLFDTESETNNNCDMDSTFKVPSIKLSKFPNASVNSPLILSPCSLDVDPDLISNFAIDLNLDQEHRSLLSHQHLQTSILKPSTLELDIELRTPPCIKTVTFNPDVLNLEDKMTLHKSSDFLYNNRERSKIWNFIPFKYFNKKVQEAVSLPNINKNESVSTIYSNISSNKPNLTLTLCKDAINDSDNNEHLYTNVVKKRKVCLNSEV